MTKALSPADYVAGVRAGHWGWASAFAVSWSMYSLN